MARILSIALLFSSMLLMHKCFASEAERGWASHEHNTETSQWQLALALGWGHKSNPVKDYDDIPIYVLPSIAWYGEHLFFDNGTLGYTLSSDDNYSLSLISGFTDDAGWFNRWDPSNLFIGGLSGSSPVSSMGIATFGRNSGPVYELKDRELTYLAGGELLLFTDFGNFRALWMHDLFAVHQGAAAQLAWYQHWQLQKLKLDLGLTLDWKSRELVDYYYGIDREEALWASPTYDGRSSINPGVELDISYPIANKLELLLLGRYTRFGAGIANSPLIKEDHSFGVFIGAAYRF